MPKSFKLEITPEIITETHVKIGYYASGAPSHVDMVEYISAIRKIMTTEDVAANLNRKFFQEIHDGKVINTMDVLRYCIRYMDPSWLSAALENGLSIKDRYRSDLDMGDMPALNYLAQGFVEFRHLELLLEHGANPNGDVNYAPPLFEFSASESACHLLFDYGATIPSAGELHYVADASERLLNVQEHHRSWIAKRSCETTIALPASTCKPRGL